jgi:hypothetical protein
MTVVDAKPPGSPFPAGGADASLPRQHGVVVLERDAVRHLQKTPPRVGPLRIAQPCAIGRIPLRLAPPARDAPAGFGELPGPGVRVGRPSAAPPRIDLGLVNGAPGPLVCNPLLSGFRVARMSLLRRWSTGRHGLSDRACGMRRALGAHRKGERAGALTPVFSDSKRNRRRRSAMSNRGRNSDARKKQKTRAAGAGGRRNANRISPNNGPAAACQAKLGKKY